MKKADEIKKEMDSRLEISGMTKILIYSGARQGVPTERLWNEKMAAVPIFIKEHKSVIGTVITASINFINIHEKVMAEFFRSRPSTPILIRQPP